MPRKRHTSSEALLQTVIEDLQSDDARRYAGAVRALVFQGPLHCLAVSPDVQPAEQAYGAGLIRAELWQFLREIVRLRGGPEDRFVAGHGIWVNDRVRLFGNIAGPRVTLGIEATGRNIAILQLAWLVERVGLDNVRVCGVRDCPRIFVKTYRREFCSVRCQKRHYMRKMRATAHVQAEQQQRRRAQRRRMKGARG